MSGRDENGETVPDKTGADAPRKYNDTIDEPEELVVDLGDQDNKEINREFEQNNVDPDRLSDVILVIF